MTDPSQQRPRLRLTPATAVAGVVALVVVVSVIVLVLALMFRHGGSGDKQGIAPSALPSQSASTTAVATGCPANVGPQDRDITEAPAATWRYQGRTAFPVSTEYGPAVTNNSGRFCFQHSPAGALFMAANAVAEGTSATLEGYREWFARAAANGPYRDSFREGSTSPLDYNDVRVDIKGFRVLDYTGETANIDIGVSALKDGQPLFASAVYQLVWQDGDWKLSADVPNPMMVNITPDLSGYIPWGA